LNLTDPSGIKSKITRFDLFKVFIASFFMQAVWNFRSLISIGFSICFLPVIGKLCDSPEEKRKFLQRHLKFFNAHPYLASYALGVSIRLEEMKTAGDQHIPETIDRLKDLLISPLGAVGDRLFWVTIKPAALLMGMLGTFLLPGTTLKLSSLVFAFLLYNIPHLYYRYQGILEGYQHPLDIYRFIGQQRFEKLRGIFFSLLVLSLLSLLGAYGYFLIKNASVLLIFFILSALYALFFFRISHNFYLVSLGTFLFFLTAAILFL
jgi:mannose/fructose/N-acetylgalactosamine-specific phosphotransferase system component IID